MVGAEAGGKERPRAGGENEVLRADEGVALLDVGDAEVPLDIEKAVLYAADVEGVPDAAAGSGPPCC